MGWVYGIVALGLVGMMVETWLSYRKAAAERQEELLRLRAAIRQHESATATLGEKLQALEAHAVELRAERDEYTAEVDLKRQEFDELLRRWRLHNPGDPFESDPGRLR